MGSLNSCNPVAFDNGVMFRQKTAEINRLMALNSPYVKLGEIKAIKAYDLLLAEKAALSAYYLPMSGNHTSKADKNAYAKDYGRSALDLNRFNVFFNYFMRRLDNAHA